MNQSGTNLRQPGATNMRSATDMRSAKVSLFNLLRAEWIKLWSLRSTYVLSSIALLIMIVAATLVAWSVSSFIISTAHPGELANLGDMPIKLLSTGAPFAQLCILILAALSVTSEWSSGQIRSTFAADPGRLGTFVAKSLNVALIGFITGVLGTIYAILIGHAFMGSDYVPLDSVEIWSSTWGVGLSMVFVTIMAQGFAMLLRNTAGSIALLVGLFFIIPGPASILAYLWEWGIYVLWALPSSAAGTLVTPLHVPEDTQLWSLVVLLLLWAIVPWTLGALREKLSDA